MSTRKEHRLTTVEKTDSDVVLTVEQLKVAEVPGTEDDDLVCGECGAHILSHFTPTTAAYNFVSKSGRLLAQCQACGSLNLLSTKTMPLSPSSDHSPG
ncbi:hypothetical protein [Reyranella sp. CPCC 100927]|uniref:hypothetical protein n=1 Tax=Reyranella sp. CPCC 100927 TaxID=2599616 RepID=UPI0011B62809|nr:hypothetical protein [Reyranella sp. CPCC 100927]TWT10627.1 hypothetical protein FQU96_16035 [Reyranella sp. CPCC 100927]